MTARAVAATVLAVVLTAILTVLGAGWVEFSEGKPPVEAFLVAGPSFVFGMFAIPGALWIVLVLIGNLWNRRRASGWAFLTNLVSAIVVALLGVVGWFVVGMTQGGWGLFVVAIALLVSVLFLAAALVALALTHFVFLRHRATSATVPSLLPDAAAA